MFKKILKLERLKQQVLDEVLARSRTLESLYETELESLKTYLSELTEYMKQTSKESRSIESRDFLAEAPQKNVWNGKTVPTWPFIRENSTSAKVVRGLKKLHFALESIDRKVVTIINKARSKILKHGRND